MPSNDGQQRTGAGTQPGGVTSPKTAVPNKPVKDTNGHGMPTPPVFPTGNTGTHK